MGLFCYPLICGLHSIGYTISLQSTYARLQYILNVNILITLNFHTMEASVRRLYLKSLEIGFHCIGFYLCLSSTEIHLQTTSNAHKCTVLSIPIFYKYYL